MTGSCPVFGFDVVLVPAAGLDQPSLESLRDAFLRLAVEAEGLEAEGLPGERWRYTITRCGSQATELDRAAVAGWAAARRDIAACSMGPLVDLGSVGW